MDTSSLSSPAVPTLSALQRARTKADVRSLLATRDINEINAAWRGLEPIKRAALSLVRAFDGEIVDVDPTENWDETDD